MKKYRITILIVFLCMIGLFTVYSSSHIWATYKYQDAFYYVKRQALFCAFGLFLMSIICRIDYHIYQRYYKVLLFVSIVLLGLVLIPGVGVVRGGSRSWFNLGLFALQPSELYKFTLIIFVANYMEKHHYKMSYFKTSLWIFFYLGLGFLLIMLQPDFGSAVVLSCSIVVMLLVSPFPLRYFVAFGLLAIVGLVMMIVAAPYRMKRILAFLDPFSDPLGAGFQGIQSLFAVGPGGLIGVGIDKSIQKYFYLPEPQTDFIFAIFAEEWGFLGGFALIASYGSLFYQMIKGCLNSRDLFGFYLVIGISSLIAIQTVINLGVVVGLFPVTGVTLPLMSYGGTSLCMTLMGLGIVINVLQGGNNML